MDIIAKQKGFESWEEMNRLVAQADISTPKKFQSFNKWKEQDGSKDGLLALGNTVDFYGCRFLDFGDNYYAKKNLISSGGITKVVWFRNADENALCQFCSKRGRINNPRGCLDEQMKACSDYEDFLHSVPLSSIDTA